MELYRSLSGFLANYESKNSIGSYFRKRRGALIKELIEGCFERNHKVDILDLGGRESYWNIFPDDFFERQRITITLVNNEEELGANRDSNRFKHVCGDACNLDSLKTMSFDFAHCNSVIEHVGDWNNMSALAREVQRLAPSYYIQTPNFWFPFEPHFMSPFFHWLPRVARIALIQKISLGHMKRQRTLQGAIEVIDSVELLNDKMFFSLFSQGEFKKERILGLPKSLIAFKRT